MKKVIVFCVVGFCNGFPVFPNQSRHRHSEKAMKLRLSMWPAQHPLTRLFADWGKDVEKCDEWKADRKFGICCKHAASNAGL